MDLREVFATNLRRLRHAKGLSQDDLAYDAGVSRSYCLPECSEQNVGVQGAIRTGNCGRWNRVRGQVALRKS
jgi:hypothetical protein